MKSIKKYIVGTSVCVLISLQCAEEQKLIAQEWNADLYDKGNRVQREAFFYFLKNNNINPNGKRILDIGCGTGNITKELAIMAEYADGIDPSNNMIGFAQKKYATIPKLSFHQAFAENFVLPKLYNLAIASFSFHWFLDKPKAIKQIHTYLEKNGEFFFTAPTSDDPTPLNLIVAEEMLSSGIGSLLKSAAEFFSAKKSKALGSSYPTRNELKDMLTDAGFEILICKQETCNILLKNRIELENLERPVVMSRPIVQYIPNMIHEYLFAEFIDKMILRMKQTDKQELIKEMTTTIVHVRKK